jgi:hypothetical protein
MSFKQIDSHVSRLTSFFVAVSVILYLIFGYIFILYIVAFDFIMRLFITKDSSLFYMSALFFKEVFNIQDKFVDSGSKRLAAYFGLFFVVMLLFAHYFDVFILTLTIAGIFLACSLLDVFLDFCLGCKIYFIIKKIYPNFMN